MYSLILGQDNGESDLWPAAVWSHFVWVGVSHVKCPSAADQSRVMQDQMTGAAMAMPPDPNKAFKVRNDSWKVKVHFISLIKGNSFMEEGEHFHKWEI